VIHFEEIITSEDVAKTNVKWGWTLLLGFPLLFLLLYYFHPSFKVDKVVLVTFGGFTLLGALLTLSREEHYGKPGGRWHVKLDDEKIYLQQPSGTQRALFLSDIKSIDHVIRATSDFDRHYVYINTKDNKSIDFGYREPQELVEGFKKAGLTVNEFKEGNGWTFDPYDRKGTRVEFTTSDEFLVRGHASV